MPVTRPLLALPIGLALALGPAPAHAEQPRLSLRLEYARGRGGEACPAEPALLRGEIRRRLGYDPFDGEDATLGPAGSAVPRSPQPPSPAGERLTVLLEGRDGGFVARVTRLNASGELLWSETFPADKPLRGTCTALMSPLGAEIRGLLLVYVPAAKPPPAPAPEAASIPASIPASTAAPEVRAAPPPEPAPRLESLEEPNPARRSASIVAYVAYGIALASLGVGIGLTAYARGKDNDAKAMEAQVHRAGGDSVCAAAPMARIDCDGLLRLWQSRDNALDARNGAYALAGVSAAIGVAATLWTVRLPETVRKQVRVSIKPGGLLISGVF